MGALFSKEDESKGYTFKLHDVSKRFDTREDVLSAFPELDESQSITEVVLSLNSYSVEACGVVAELISHYPSITSADLSDMFTGRLRSEVVESMQVLSSSFAAQSLQYLDVSNNAFGPDGVRSFQSLLESANNLVELHINNNGLGPMGAELVAQGIRNLRLEVFCSARNLSLIHI